LVTALAIVVFHLMFSSPHWSLAACSKLVFSW